MILRVLRKPLQAGAIVVGPCEENNKSLWEGRIKLWLPPGTSQPRK